MNIGGFLDYQIKCPICEIDCEYKVLTKENNKFISFKNFDKYFLINNVGTNIEKRCTYIIYHYYVQFYIVANDDI